MASLVVSDQRLGGVPVRVYEPRLHEARTHEPGSSGPESHAVESHSSASHEPPMPWATLVWAHGGSFVRGTLDWPESDWVSRRFAEAGIRVYAVDYVLASEEVKAPLPADDVATVLREVLTRHDEPVVVGGASAGAHLATAAALAVTRQVTKQRATMATMRVSALLLVYPTLHRTQRADAKIAELTAALPAARQFDAVRIAAMYDFYLGEAPVDTASSGSEAAEVVGELSRERLADLPTTIMVNAFADDLRASGEQFAEQLRAAAVRVTSHTQFGTVHGYLNRPDESPQARRDAHATIDFIVGELRAIHEPQTQEPEIVAPASLTLEDGRLNREAVGWATRPIIDTSGIGRGRGRNKRWEYWNIATPSHIIGITISHIDYACVHEVWIYDRETGAEGHRAMTLIPPRGTVLPSRLEHSRSMARAKNLAIDIDEILVGADGALAGAGDVLGGTDELSTGTDEVERGTRLRVEIEGVSLDVVADLPAGHERLALVVPWSDTHFQYTVKDIARPAHGTLVIDGVQHEIGGSAGDAWAVLDHGRGRWPYDIRWNWGAASGRCDSHVFGLQVGAKWTAGTGVSENAFFVDGRMHKIHGDTRWHYDPHNFLAPWRVIGGGLDATLVPFTNKVTRTNLLVLQGHTDQCFGLWHGTFETATGERYEFEGLIGWAEEVHNRW